jgi:hypothetical protein
VGIYLSKDAYEQALICRDQVIKRLLVDGENALVLYPTGGTYSILDVRALSARSLDKQEERACHIKYLPFASK